MKPERKHFGQREQKYRSPITERSLMCLRKEAILKEIRPGSSLEGMMPKLKLQYFGHLMRRVDSSEKTLILIGIEGRRRRGWQRMRWVFGITDLMDMSLSELQEMVMYREPWCASEIHGITKSRTRLSDWTELNWRKEASVGVWGEDDLVQDERRAVDRV